MSKRSKICFGLLLVLFTIFGLSLNACSDVNAASTLGTSSFDMYWTTRYGTARSWTNNILYGSPTSNNYTASDVLYYQFNSSAVTFRGTEAILHFETNIVQSSVTQTSTSYWSNLSHTILVSCSSNRDGTLTTAGKNVSTAVTEWYTTINNYTYKNYTLTLYGDVVLTGYTKDVSHSLTCMVGSDNSSLPFYVTMPPYPSDYPVVYFEQNPMTIDFTENLSNALLQMQTNIMQQQLDRDSQATDNISNQSTSDIDGATNQQTTNIIGTISSFVSALGTIQTGSCELTLPFPNYAGGNVVANPCSYKEKAPDIITIGSSLVLIGLFIPLAFVVLKMIYNEIRSWTNG